MSSREYGMLVGMALLVFGVVLANTRHLLRPLWRRAVSRSWPRVSGTVENGSIDHVGDAADNLYRLEIAFSYTVLEERYGGNQTVGLADYARARELLRKLTHASIVVRYNPSKPSDCVVDVAASGGWKL